MKKIARNGGGFTLVEVTVALFLLIVAFMGLLSLSAMAINGNAFSKATTTATTLAADKLESLRAKGFGDGELTPGTHVDGANPFQGIFSRTWTVTDGAGYKDIVVSVSWTWQDSTRNVSVRTLKADTRG